RGYCHALHRRRGYGRQGRGRSGRKAVLRTAHARQDRAVFRTTGLRQAVGLRRAADSERFRFIRRKTFSRCSMNTYSWLVRREFWENRAIWIVPIVIGAALTLAALFGRVDFAALSSPAQNRVLGGTVLF